MDEITDVDDMTTEDGGTLTQLFVASAVVGAGWFLGKFAMNVATGTVTNMAERWQKKIEAEKDTEK